LEISQPDNEEEVTLELYPEEGQTIEIELGSDKKEAWSTDKSAVVQAVWISSAVTSVIGLIVSFYFYT
jgi:hypothetical protein